jgi:choline dehydrogenase
LSHQSFDYVVVGAGSAGCVLAERLSADGRHSIALLEAGARVRNPLYALPMLPGHLLKQPRHNWFYSSEPQPGMYGAEVFQPVGRLVGGSFRLNGAQYVRGNPADYDGWAAAGCRGWSYAEVLPYFRRIEHFTRGEDAYHGTEGPLWVERADQLNPLSEAFLRACAQAGYPANDDLNGAHHLGFGPYDFNTRRGRKWTTADALLYPSLDRGNLELFTRARVHRIGVDGGQARTIEFRQGRELRRVEARREIVLAAGAINTPQLLMLSGIGPPDALAKLGIQTIVDSPAVGVGLQDHLNAGVEHATREPVSLARVLRLDRLAYAVTKAIVARRGPVAQSALEAGGFFSLAEDEAGPEFQVVFVPLSVIGAAIRMPWVDGLEAHGFSAIVWPNRPRSEGRVWLRSRDPEDRPAFDPCYLQSEGDLELTRAGLKELRRIVSQPAFDELRGAELQPGPDVQDDAALDEYIRRKSKSGYHPCASARMGTGRDAVVDPELRVRGVDGLRIADASVMPRIVSGNTNATTIMIADKASDMILGRSPLPAQELDRPAQPKEPV